MVRDVDRGQLLVQVISPEVPLSDVSVHDLAVHRTSLCPSVATVELLVYHIGELLEAAC